MENSGYAYELQESNKGSPGYSYPCITEAPGMPYGAISITEISINNRELGALVKAI
jgi:hypothetical protein